MELALLTSPALLSPAQTLTCKGWRGADIPRRLLQLLLHLAVVGLVLPQHGTAPLQAPEGLESLQLVLHHLLGAADVGRELHDEEHEGLGEVVLQHVPDHPVLLVEAGAAWAQPEGKNAAQGDLEDLSASQRG